MPAGWGGFPSRKLAHGWWGGCIAVQRKARTQNLHNVVIQGTAESNGSLLRGGVGGCCVPDAISQHLLLLHHVGLFSNLGVHVEHLAQS